MNASLTLTVCLQPGEGRLGVSRSRVGSRELASGVPYHGQQKSITCGTRQSLARDILSEGDDNPRHTALVVHAGLRVARRARGRERGGPNFAQRIKAAAEKRFVRGGTSGSETYEVTVEQGTEVQKTRVGAGQVDASVPLSTWKEVDPEPKVIRPADVLDVNPKPLAPDAVVRDR